MVPSQDLRSYVRMGPMCVRMRPDILVVMGTYVAHVFPGRRFRTLREPDSCAKFYGKPERFDQVHRRGCV